MTAAATTTVSPVEPAQEKRLSRAAAQAERARENRDAEIVLAFLEGAGIREIARAVNMSHPAVKYILDKHAEDPRLVEEYKRRAAHRESLNALKRQKEREHRQRRGGGPDS